MLPDDPKEPQSFKTQPLVIHPLEPIPPGQYRQTIAQKIMNAVLSWVFFGGIICGGLYYGVHLALNYQKVHAEIREKASYPVKPKVEDGSISETGYIFSMRRETSIQDANFNLVWFISVPATGARYSCQYGGGYQDFKIGDGVTLIHPKSDEDSVDSPSYIVGLHDDEQRKASLIYVNNLEELELESH